MNIVLDTHIVIYAGDGSLSPARIALLEDVQNQLFVSSFTLWEIAKLRARAKITFTNSPQI